MYLWQPGPDEFVIPPPERWLRMGVNGGRLAEYKVDVFRRGV